ncbi:hypothetical protein GXW78_25650 [Roseomonas terrae]|uniref:Uncharacterized protein n=1 Tax=Neoroseomonas terrae TaxID=424799 RepID=A0ABS5ER11_9PROT|nr:hypothetical protein [Neoroseomonas terrae]MBR0653067.1 hypothetical protein [Neoroseomonas terrae]
MLSRLEYPDTDLLAVARANSGWSFGPDGVLAERLANALRPDWDAATGAHRGLLVEAAITNRITDPRFQGAAWSQSNVVLAPNAGLAPNGLTEAALLTDGGATSTHVIGAANMTVATIGDVYTSYVMARAGAGSFIQLLWANAIAGFGSWANFDLANGVVGNTGANVSSGIRPLRDGWFLCWMSGAMTGAATAAALNLYLITGAGQGRAPSYAAAGLSVYLWGGLTALAGFVPSPVLSPIGSPGASTRSADNVSFIDVPRWLTPDAGTFVIDFTPGDVVGGDRELLTIDDGTSSNRIRLSLIAGGTTVRLRSIVGGVIAGTVAMASGPALVRHTVRASYGPAGLVLSVNGAAPISTAVAIPPGLQRGFLGNAAGGNHLNGWIGPRVEHLTRQYTDAAAPDGYSIRDR